MIVYIDMDDVLCDFSNAHQTALANNPGIKFPTSQYGFFTKLVPLQGALAAVNDLISSAKYDPYILTAPSIMNPLCYTEKRVWIEDMFGLEFVNKLIISPNKGLLRGQYLIDDNCFGKGQENFSGELIHFGGKDFPDWQAVREYLKF
jgi:5'(3')-deoxyribonucleotidase